MMYSVESVILVRFSHGVELPEEGLMPKHVATILVCNNMYQRFIDSTETKGINSAKTG